MKKMIILIPLVSLISLSCGKAPTEPLKRVTELSTSSPALDKIHANYLSTASNMQQITSDMATVSFYPGTLSVNAEIIIGFGSEDLSDKSMQSLSQSVSITANIEGDANIYIPMSLSIPLPLGLTARDNSKLIIAYDSIQNEKGIIDNKNLVIKENKVNFRGSVWGSYQIMESK